MTITLKKLFLIDSLGATLTAFMLAFVLAKFNGAFGVAQGPLYLLAAFALCFAVYSFLCASLSWQKLVLLRTIALANIVYCFTTAYLIFTTPTLTLLGCLYFAAEIVVVLGLAIFELYFSKSLNN